MDRTGNTRGFTSRPNNRASARTAAATVLIMLLLLASSTHAALQAEASSSDAVTLTWTAPGDDGNVGTASEYDIRYSTSPITESSFGSATQAAGEPSPQAAGGVESFTVTGLQPGTTYYFALKTADEIPNWSLISNVASAKTDPEQVPPAVVADLHKTDSTSTTVTIAWTAPGDDGNTGTASEYDIRYATSPITDANWSSATQVSGEPSPKAAGGSESFTVAGLAASTTYYFALKTADDVPNWSLLSNSASGGTGTETVAPSAIANLGASNETETTIRLSWTAPGDDGGTGQASEYDIRYSTAPITVANWDEATQVTGEPAPKTSGSFETFTVTGLTNTTTYYFAIKTADEVPNWSSLSNVVSRQTAADQTPPAPVDDLQASTGTDNGMIDLSWTSPGDDGMTGTAKLYLIGYSQQLITEQNWTSASVCTDPPAPSGPGSAETACVSSLEPGRKYYIALRTVDEAGNLSELSNIDSAEAGVNIIADVNDGEDDLPSTYSLGQNYPNPFNPTTTIEYTLPRAAHVRLDIYNVLGQLTATLVDEYRAAGTYQAVWDGFSTASNQASTGVYVYHLQAGEFNESKTMVLLK